MRKQAYKALFVRAAALKLRKLWFNILLNEQRPSPTLHFLPHIDSPSAQKCSAGNAPCRAQERHCLLYTLRLWEILSSIKQHLCACMCHVCWENEGKCSTAVKCKCWSAALSLIAYWWGVRVGFCWVLFFGFFFCLLNSIPWGKFLIIPKRLWVFFMYSLSSSYYKDKEVKIKTRNSWFVALLTISLKFISFFDGT